MRGRLSKINPDDGRSAIARAPSVIGAEPAENTGSGRMGPTLDAAMRGSASGDQRLQTAHRKIAALLQEQAALIKTVARLTQMLDHERTVAYHDELTGLPNRRLLADRFKQSAALGVRQNKQVAVLFLDLDGFKNVNTALGHVTADTLLRQVANRLSGSIRTADTACRFGGDEFVVLLPDLENRQRAIAAAEHIRARVSGPFVVDGKKIRLSTSIGISIYPVDGESLDDLLRVADRAMYREKTRNSMQPVAGGRAQAFDSVGGGVRPGM